MSIILEAIQKQIESEYGRPLAEIEAAVETAGMEVLAFRLVNEPENFLRRDLAVDRWRDTIGKFIPVRLILRPKPKRRILLEETGETRCAVAGEYASVEKVAPWAIVVPRTTNPYRIWTARELKPGEAV